MTSSASRPPLTFRRADLGAGKFPGQPGFFSKVSTSRIAARASARHFGAAIWWRPSDAAGVLFYLHEATDRLRQRTYRECRPVD